MSTTRVMTGGAADGNFGTAGNWNPSGSPASGDTLYIPPTCTMNITAGLDQHTVALAAVYFMPGYTGTVGSASLGYLQIDPTALYWGGSGVGYINLGSANIDVNISGANGGTASSYGLYLLGSNIANVLVDGPGDVAVAGQANETATVATCRVTGAGALLTLGSGVTATTYEAEGGGNITSNCAFTTATLYGSNSQFTHQGTGAGATINVYNGKCFPLSSGTITTLNLYGGTTDATGTMVARTFSTVNLKPYSGSCKFIYDPAVVTVSAFGSPGMPIQLTAKGG